MRKYLCRAAGLITVVAAGLAPWAPATASARGMAHSATDCFKVTATTPLATAPNAVAVNPVTNKVYVANFRRHRDGDRRATNADRHHRGGHEAGCGRGQPGDQQRLRGQLQADTVSVIDGATNTVTATIAGRRGAPAAVAVNPMTNTVYVANARHGTVSVIDGATNTVTATIRCGEAVPLAVAVEPDDQHRLRGQLRQRHRVGDRRGHQHRHRHHPVGDAPGRGGGQPGDGHGLRGQHHRRHVSVIDGPTNTVTATIRVGRSPQGITVGPRSIDIYVANAVTSTVSVIRGQTNTVFTTIRLPEHSFPEGLATDSETNTIYAADNGSDTVSAIAVCPK